MLQETYERLMKPEDVVKLQTRIFTELSANINDNKVMLLQ